MPLGRLRSRSDRVGLWKYCFKYKNFQNSVKVLFPVFHGNWWDTRRVWRFFEHGYLYYFSWTYNKEIPASIMLAFMLAAYYSDRDYSLIYV